GSLYMWGSNGSGQIGNGSMDDQATPVKVLENVGTVSLGRYYSGAITKDGSLYMWGNNEYGQVGNGSTENQTTPVKVLENVKLPIVNDSAKSRLKFSEIASNTIVYFDDHGDKKSLTFDYSMDFCLEKDATEYNPDLAYMLAALANSAYHKEGVDFTLLKDVDSGIFPDDPLAITESLRNLGFDAENGDVREFNYFSSDSDDNYGENLVAFTLATKEMSDGTALISIVVCDSYDDMAEFTSDWRSNVDFKNLGTGSHEGFDAAAKEIIQKLNVLINDKSIDGDKVKFVITGHSRGAAVANLVAKTLIDSGVPTNSVYDYNFACPDSGRDYSSNWNSNGEYDSLYNINNVRDIVGVIPGNLFNTYLNTNKFLWGELPDTVFWGKYGHTYFFSENGDAVTETMIGGFDQHSATLYLDHMSKQQSTDSFTSWEQVRLALAANAVQGKNGKIFGVFCPVDIEIIDEDGVKAAEIVNGQSQYYSESFGDVVIVTAEDQSLVYVNGNKEYFVIFTGSDTGEMTYCVSDAVSGSEYEKEIMYTNVPLSQGRKMVSILNNNEQSDKVTLVLFDEKLNPKKQIDHSGAELELSDDLKEEYSNLPLEKPVTEYKITYDLDGGQVTGNPTTYTEDTDTFTLNNPTKTGYTFTGWTGSNGNTPELTVTIVKGTTGDLSYTANWSKETSNDSGSVSGGDVSDSVSGGDVSDSVSGGDSNNSEDADTTPDDSGSVSGGDISGSENDGDGNNSEDVGAAQAEHNSSAEDVSITIVENSVSNEKASADYSYKTGDKTGADNILLIICVICMTGCLVKLYMIKKYE
ncbi:MAG: InlB B-repeat-containing protein, partial [Acetatifactor sp.]|nr:InlB B-repeat-containing protein [Acetatifactor sp.]